MKNDFYITTTIPYVNAPPHIGHACELVQADAIARFARLLGKRVQFQTGTDENAFKNVLSATALGISVQQLVKQNSERFHSLCTALNISFDQFVRTSEPAHFAAVQKFCSALQSGDVYTQEYRGLYCIGCEDFFQERDLVNGACPDHAGPITEIAETNYFFRLSRYQDHVRELIASRRIQIVPQTREAEVLSFIDRGLNDISLSRNAERSAGWGVPFPGDENQVVYVWIDALVNYLSGLGYPTGSKYTSFWERGESRLHVIGKNVWKFHAIYWPALLLSAGLEVPDHILVHGFLTNDGQKISKSNGTSVDPGLYVNEFGVDAVRYFLLRHVHPFEDTDFSTARVADAYHADLANGLGNLCSRLTALAESVELSLVCEPTGAYEVNLQGPAAFIESNLQGPHASGETNLRGPNAFGESNLQGSSLFDLPTPIGNLLENIKQFRADLSLETIWTEVRHLNQLLSSETPWTDIKAGRIDVARQKLTRVAFRLYNVAYWLAPFLPTTANAIRQSLTQNPIRKCDPLFPRREQTAHITARE